MKIAAKNAKNREEKERKSLGIIFDCPLIPFRRI